MMFISFFGSSLAGVELNFVKSILYRYTFIGIGERYTIILNVLIIFFNVQFLNFHKIYSLLGFNEA